MKNHWYCHVEGQDYGPFTWEQLRAMAAEGRIVSNSSVRRDIDQQWFQAAQVPGLLPKAHAAAKKSGPGASTIGKSPAASRNSDSGLMAAVGSDPSKSSTAIKRPKKLASHSSGSIPVGRIPVGSVPVGNVPVGQPVAAHAVAVKAAPAGIAVGQPAASAFAFSVATAPPTNKSEEPPEPVKQGTSPLLIVGILGGAVALVAVIGIGILVYSLTRPAQSSDEQIADATQQEMRGALEQMAKDLQKNPPTEFNPQGVAEEMQKALGGNLDKLPAGSTAPSSAAPPSAAEATKLLKSIARWTNMSQVTAIELNKLKLSLASAWLASDESGTRVEVSSTGPTAAKFVFIQLQVKNFAPVVRKYKSWNAAAGTSVVLADQNDAVLNLVPPSSTPGADRLATVDIQPGQSVTDTLVFTAPGGAVEKFKLALAKSAFAENAKFKTGSHFALEIPLEVLLAGGPSSAATPTEEPIAANRTSPSIPGENPPEVIEPLQIGDEPMPAGGQPPAAPPAKKENRPPTREELNKQFEEFSKKEGQPEPKKGEAQK